MLAKEENGRVVHDLSGWPEPTQNPMRRSNARSGGYRYNCHKVS